MGNPLPFSLGKSSLNWKGMKQTALAIAFLFMGVLAYAQPEVTVRFANPQFNCETEEYCLDVEFQSNTSNVELFGMNVRFYYDDDVLEFLDFRDFTPGYSSVAPSPPFVNTGDANSGPNFFGLTGPAEFINGAIQLTSIPNGGVPDISTSDWTKLFQVCFSVVDESADLDEFCPSVIWDLEANTSNGGFQPGAQGVVISVVNPDPNFDSSPANEAVEQYNWEYDGSSTFPFSPAGNPTEASCISIRCIDLELDKSVDNATPIVGSEIDFTIDVTNTGTDPATNVVVSDILPDGFEYLSHDAGTYDEVSGDWEIGTIAGDNGTASITITVRVKEMGDYTNLASVKTATGEDPDSTPGNEVDTDDDDDVEDDPDDEDDGDGVVIDVQRPSIELTKKDALDLGGDNILNAGDKINYTFVITNTGDVTLDNILIEDPDISNLACNGGSPSTLAPGNSVTCTGEYTITQTDINAGMYVNTATVKSMDPDDNEVNDISDDPDDPTNVDTEGDNEPDDPTVTMLVQNPVIGIAKMASAPLSNGDGSFTTTITLNIENHGNVPLGDIQVTDDLTTEFGTFVSIGNLDATGEYTVSNLSIDNNSADVLTLNNGYNGSSDQDLLNVGAGGVLAIGEVVTISFDLTFFPAEDKYENQAIATGDTPANDDGTPDKDTEDKSDDGTNPDPNNNDDPTDPEEDDPTPIDPNENPVIGIAKMASTPIANGDGSFTTTITLNIENHGDVKLGDIQVTDDLTTEFGTFVSVGNLDATGEYTVSNLSIDNNSADALTLNNGYNGAGDQNLLNVGAGGVLEVGEVVTISFDLRFFPAEDKYENQAIATGDTPANDDGTPDKDTEDKSDDGTNPDPNNNDDPTDPEEDDPTPIDPNENPVIGIAKMASTPISNGDGSFSTTITLNIENHGDVKLGDIQVTDDLTTEFGTFVSAGNLDATGEYTVSSLSIDNNSADALTLNNGYNGSSDQNLLNVGAGGVLEVDEVVTISFVLTFFPAEDKYENQAIATGDTPANDDGTPDKDTEDKSDDGTNPDPNNNDDPTDPEEDDPTPIDPNENPVIGIAKMASTPVSNGDGSFSTTITLNIENHGDVTLGDIQVTDDLTTEFGTFVSAGNLDATGEYTVSNLSIDNNSNDPLTLNNGYNGSSDQNLLNVGAGGVLEVDEVVTISFVLTFFPAEDKYENQAIATGDTPANDDGTPDKDTEDKSDDGTNPDPNNNDDPTDPEEDDPTPIDPNENPVIGIAKMASNPISNGDGTFSTTITLNIENHGDVKLGDIQVTDDLTTEFGTYISSGNLTTAGQYTVSNLSIDNNSADALTLNNGYNGSSNQDLLNVGAGGVLEVGEVVTISFDLMFFPDQDMYENQAIATGDTPANDDGTPDKDTEDKSDDGTNPDPNNNDDPTDPEEDDPTPIDPMSNPVIGIAKMASTPVSNGDGSFSTTITLNVENHGDVTLGDIQVTDDLTTEFGTFVSIGNLDATGEYTVSNLSIDNNSADALTLNNGYNGSSDQNLLNVGAGGVLDQGEVVTISFDLTFFPAKDKYENQAIATGDTPANDDGTPDKDTEDKSDDGTNPDPNNNDDPTDPEEDDPTPIDPNENPVIGIAKMASTPIANGDGSFSTTITLNIENHGDVKLGDIQVTDDLTTEFGTFVSVGNLDATGEYTVSNLSIDNNSADALTLNNGYNGAGDQNLLNVGAGGVLEVGEVVTISFDLTFFPAEDMYENQAIATGDTPANDDGTPDKDTEDKSDDGTNPDPNNNDDPTDPEEDDPTPIDPNENPVIGIAKSASSPVFNSNQGTFSTTISLVVENHGDVTLGDVQVTDDLTTEFGTYVPGTPNSVGQYTVSNLAINNSLNTGSDLALATGGSEFDGEANQGLLDLTGTLPPGSVVTISFDLIFNPAEDAYENQAIATGDTPANDDGDVDNDTEDKSDDGTNPDPNNNDDPTDPEEDDPTPIEVPCVTIETFVLLEGAMILDDGSENYGTVMRTDLNDLRLLPGQTYQDGFTGDLITSGVGQPYDQAPWNYFGNEGDGFNSGGSATPPVDAANYPETVVDWVLVSLRTDPAGTGGPLCQAAALLHEDGRVEFVEEFKCCELDLEADYYLVIEHRNHLIIMSADPISIINKTITYDFRVQQSYIDDFGGFGSFVGQKEVTIGNQTRYLMYGGNGNQTLSGDADTDINFDDRTFWELQNSVFGRYRIGDYNLNGDVNFNDRRLWEINNGSFTSVPRN